VTSEKGTKLSKAAVDDLGAGAEAGYDLSEAERQRVGPGHPSLAEGGSPRTSPRVAPLISQRCVPFELAAATTAAR